MSNRILYTNFKPVIKRNYIGGSSSRDDTISYVRLTDNNDIAKRPSSQCL